MDAAYSLSHHVMEDAEYAEDLAKRIFARVWETLAEVKRDTNFNEWLAQTAHSVIREQIRRKNLPHTFSKKLKPQDIELICIEVFSEDDSSEKRVQAAKPKRNFWVEIQGQIETESIAPNDRDLDPGGIKFRHIAVVAFALVVGGVAFLLITAPAPEPELPAETSTAIEIPQTPEETPPVTDERYSQLQNEYNVLKAEVLGSVDIDAGDHDTDIQGSMEENLGVVEKTISDIVGAMGDDPENEMLEKMLVATYKKQIKLLQKFMGLGD